MKLLPSEGRFQELPASLQLSPGAVAQTTQTAVLDGLHVRRIAYHVSIGGRIAAGAGKLVVAYFPNQAGLAKINGRLWLDQRLGVIHDDVEISTSAPAVLELIEIDIERFPLIRALISNAQAGSNWVALLPATSSVAARAEKQIRQAITSGIEMSREPHGFQTLVASLYRAIECGLAPEQHIPRDEGPRDAVKATKAYVWSNMCSDVALAVLADSIGCSPRTLSNYYLRLYGMSPMRYLKTMRLNHVRGLLRDPKCEQTIADVAADHGFWHMGHFSEQYRYLFGETASETLRAARTPRCR